MSEPFRIKLPATSANLGSGFDAAAIALDFHLEIEASPAAEFSIHATGRDAERCGRLEDNLVLDLYRATLTREGRSIVPLALAMKNEIPLGMGCGSSAAGRLAALALSVRFGQLGWSSERILEEAAKLEGHPDNVAACWLGGFVAAAWEGDNVRAIRVSPPAAWRAIVILPIEPLPTVKARAVLPESYSRADVVANLQSATLLGLAFAHANASLLRTAMADRIHQPYRESICPMLPRILPLAGQAAHISGAALSGAGPAILAILESDAVIEPASSAIYMALKGLPPAELLVTRFQPTGAAETNGLQHPAKLPA